MSGMQQIESCVDFWLHKYSASLYYPQAGAKLSSSFPFPRHVSSLKLHTSIRARPILDDIPSFRHRKDDPLPDAHVIRLLPETLVRYLSTTYADVDKVCSATSDVAWRVSTRADISFSVEQKISQLEHYVRGGDFNVDGDPSLKVRDVFVSLTADIMSVDADQYTRYTRLLTDFALALRSFKWSPLQRDRLKPRILWALEAFPTPAISSLLLSLAGISVDEAIHSVPRYTRLAPADVSILFGSISSMPSIDHDWHAEMYVAVASNHIDLAKDVWSRLQPLNVSHSPNDYCYVAVGRNHLELLEWLLQVCSPSDLRALSFGPRNWSNGTNGRVLEVNTSIWSSVRTVQAGRVLAKYVPLSGLYRHPSFNCIPYAIELLNEGTLQCPGTIDFLHHFDSVDMLHLFISRGADAQHTLGVYDACVNRNLPKLKVLLDAGYEVNHVFCATQAAKTCALMSAIESDLCAAAKRPYTTSLSFTALLLKAGADPNLIVASDTLREERTPLASLLQSYLMNHTKPPAVYDLIDMLISYGADPNLKYCVRNLIGDIELNEQESVVSYTEKVYDRLVLMAESPTILNYIICLGHTDDEEYF